MKLEKEDFPTAIRHLEKRGLTQRQIAKEIGTSAPQVNRIKNHDQQPSYELGQSLLLFLSTTVTDT